jgi:hypothetical protein
LCCLRGTRLGIGLNTANPVSALPGIQSRDVEQLLFQPGPLRDLLRHRVGAYVASFCQQRRITRQSPELYYSLMLKIPSNRSDTIVEFRRGSDGNIQTREVLSRLQDSSLPWRNLTRLEMLFYLNCGGIVGVWLEELRRQGFIQTREKRRALAAAHS